MLFRLRRQLEGQDASARWEVWSVSDISREGGRATHTVAIFRVLKHLKWLIRPELAVLREQEREYTVKDERPRLRGYLRLDGVPNTAHVCTYARSERCQTYCTLSIHAFRELGIDHIRANLAGAREAKHGAMRYEPA